jgi:DNA gyrase/topoisomerase IV subunit B
MNAASFQQFTHQQHVLKRKEMYIGPDTSEPCSAFVLEKDGLQMELREGLLYSPAMLKVVDEILVNAVDHATRSRQLLAAYKGAKTHAHAHADSDAGGDDGADGMSEGGASSEGGAAAIAAAAPHVVKKIEVSLDRETGVITVANDGDGIPVEKHDTHGGIYVPELIFGHLLTSANFDDDDNAGGSKRTVGGQNGIGAKACNILSRWFEIEVVDRSRRLRYRQRFEDNMSIIGVPRIDKTAARRSSTTVRFLPDYLRLGMSTGRLSDDMHALIVKRVYDVAAVTPADVAVWLDGKRIEVKTFERYIDMYVGPRGQAGRAYERPCDGWEIAAALSDGTGLKQVSFVNGVATLRGGKHVDHVVSQICRKLCDLVAARRKGVTAKPQYVRDNLLVFVRATVPGPRFDSQSKETLTTLPSQVRMLSRLVCAA